MARTPCILILKPDFFDFYMIFEINFCDCFVYSFQNQQIKDQNYTYSCRKQGQLGIHFINPYIKGCMCVCLSVCVVLPLVTKC